MSARNSEFAVYDHAARPGPLYWDFRCLRCGLLVDDHAPWFARLRWRWTR